MATLARVEKLVTRSAIARDRNGSDSEGKSLKLGTLESDSLGARTEIEGHFRSIERMNWDCIVDRKHIQKWGLLRNWTRSNSTCRSRIATRLLSSYTIPLDTFQTILSNRKFVRVFNDTISFGTMNLESDAIVYLVTYNRQL